MISFYENSSQNQMKYQRKPDELSFLSDDEDDATVGFSKNKRMSQLTATDSAYFSESSNQATTIINPSKEIASPSPHHNVILWQKQQQQYQKHNNSPSSPNVTPTPSFENGNDMTSINPLDTIPQIDEWDTHSSENNSIKISNNINKLRYSSPRGSNELSYNTPEQRTQRIQLRMSQWKEKLELMSGSSAVSSSSSVVGYSGRSSPNPNINAYKRVRSNRHPSFTSSVDMENGFDQPFSSARSVYSVNSLPNSVFDEKYNSFAEDDRESVFSLRSSNFHSNYNPNSNAYIPPRSRSSLEVRNPHRSSRVYNAGTTSPLKESRIHIMQAELENSQRIYKQKLQQINQMKQDIEQYQYKLEEIREKEIEQARQETIEELEATVIKNLKLEIEALQNKLQETTKELEHSKTYSDMLRNELITLKMNEQVFKDDNESENIHDEVIEPKREEKKEYYNNEIRESEVSMENTFVNNDLKSEQSQKSDELRRLEMLEKELKKKNEEIIELKKKLDKSTKLNELSQREIELLNKKVENHKQAREDIERRHTKLVDVASANEIELNKLRYKLDMITQRQDKALRKMQRRYSSILETEEDENEIVSFENNSNCDNLSSSDHEKTNKHQSKMEFSVNEEEKDDITAVEKEIASEGLSKEEKNQNENNSSIEISNTLDHTSLIDDTINDILDLSELENNSLSDSDDLNSDNLEEILNQLELSDLDIDDEEDIDLKDILLDDETFMI